MLDIGLQGHSLVSVETGHFVDLTFSNAVLARIEGDFTLSDGHRATTVSPDGAQAMDVQPLQALVRHTVTSSTARSGALTIRFSNGVTLRAQPDPAYEAWSITGPGDRKIVCMPGGELAVWSSSTSG